MTPAEALHARLQEQRSTAGAIAAKEVVAFMRDALVANLAPGLPDTENREAVAQIAVLNDVLSKF